MFYLDSVHGSAVALPTVSRPPASAIAAEALLRLRQPTQEARS